MIVSIIWSFTVEDNHIVATIMMKWMTTALTFLHTDLIFILFWVNLNIKEDMNIRWMKFMNNKLDRRVDRFKIPIRQISKSRWRIPEIFSAAICVTSSDFAYFLSRWEIESVILSIISTLQMVKIKKKILFNIKLASTSFNIKLLPRENTLRLCVGCYR